MGRMAASRSLTPEACDAAMAGIVYDRWNKMKRGKFRGKKLKGLYDLGEAPQAYKNIDLVVQDLLDANMVELIASFRPLISYKTRKK